LDGPIILVKCGHGRTPSPFQVLRDGIEHTRRLAIGVKDELAALRLLALVDELERVLLEAGRDVLVAEQLRRDLALACVAICLAVQALFMRFGQGDKSIFDPVRDDAYGIYVVQPALLHVDARPERPLRTSHKKGRGPLDQPKGRHCADRVRRDHVEPIDCALNQGRFEAKRHCGADQAARR
jgi:hypothetical protein